MSYSIHYRWFYEIWYAYLILNQLGKILVVPTRTCSRFGPLPVSL